MAIRDSRRRFLKNSVLASAGFYIIPRHVMGRGFIAPSDKLTIASIGVGGKGADDIKHFSDSGKANIAFLCDVDDVSAADTRKACPDGWDRASALGKSSTSALPADPAIRSRHHVHRRQGHCRRYPA